MLRLFFALQPAPLLSRSITERATPLVAWLRASPVSADNVHATLSFIGSCAEQRLDALLAVGAAVRGAPATLRFDAYEYWRKPRILCATAPVDAADPAHRLAVELHDVATRAGFTPDDKPFRPHLTLARKADPALVEELKWPQPVEPGFVVHCENFVLMESRRGEHGSIYSVVQTWPLDGATDA